MAPRPAKRQRRSTFVLSDDSDEGNGRPSSEARRSSLQREITLDGRTSQTVSPVKSTKGRAVVRKPAPKPSPKSSPEKARKNTRPKNEPDKTKSLHNFFTKAADEERWRKKSLTPDLDIQNGELGDAIEDDELSDETLQELGLKTDTASVVLDKRKPVVTAVAGGKSTSDGGGLPSSQRFVRSTLPRSTLSNRNLPSDTEHSVSVEGHRPWADRYGPSNLEELVVHKKKVGDVQNWLQGKVDRRNSQKLLVLKGPAGSGKTTTLSLLAQAMGLQLVSWHNPTVSEAGANNSTALQFDEFLNRGGQFGSLAFDQDLMTSDTSKADSAHRVLVIEEFPATMTRLSNVLQSFRSVILQYLARSRATSTITLRGQQSSSDNPPPVVLIISETLLSSSTALTDSFTAHRLLGPEILNHPFVTVMDFNPVAPTFMTKALDLVMKKEARDSRRRRMPGPAVIQRLADMGDVRSAVNSLEFLCLRGGDGAEWSGTVAAKAKKLSRDTVPLTEMEKNSLQLVNQRETTLDMFHAAGKIVYNKREDPRVLDTRAEPPPKPPDHLMHIYSSKVSQVDIEALLNETGTDIQTFISTLHENYILSCNGDTFEESFDGCSDILSISDILNPDSRPTRRANSNHYATTIQAGSSDTLRQDEISFQVATRGLLFSLPYPVNRATPPGSKKSDTFKMFYPASLRLWKPTEELDSLIEMFVHGEGMSKLDAAAGSNSLSNTPGIDGGVATWRTRTFAAVPSPEAKRESGTDFGHEQDEDDVEDTVPRPVRHAKDTLTLEILPYMTQIFGARKRDTSIIERITKFRPAAFQSAAATGSEAFEDDNESTAGENRARAGVFARTTPAGAPPAVAGLPRGSLGVNTNTFAGSTGSYDAQSAVDAASVEKLYISDDDIEDD